MSNPQAKTATIPNNQPPISDDLHHRFHGDGAKHALSCVEAHLPQLGQSTGAIEGLTTMLQNDLIAKDSSDSDLRTLSSNDAGTLHDAIACCAAFASHLVESIGDCIAAAEEVQA